jgi:hypothetical protein
VVLCTVKNLKGKSSGDLHRRHNATEVQLREGDEIHQVCGLQSNRRAPIKRGTVKPVGVGGKFVHETPQPQSVLAGFALRGRVYFTGKGKNRRSVRNAFIRFLGNFLNSEKKSSIYIQNNLDFFQTT